MPLSEALIRSVNVAAAKESNLSLTLIALSAAKAAVPGERIILDPGRNRGFRGLIAPNQNLAYRQHIAFGDVLNLARISAHPLTPR
jgi:hypothetical protein